MKAVTLLVNSFLPPEHRDPGREFSKKGLDHLLANLARSHPEQYAKVIQQIMDTGRKAAYLQGETLTLNDLKPVIDKPAHLARMDKELTKVDSSKLSEADKHDARLQIWQRYAGQMEKETLENAVKNKNNLGFTVVSGARGNAFQLKAMLTTPALYTDYKDRVIPLFVRHSFSEGLRPAEYAASSFGVRRSIISTKSATAEAGDLGKQAVQASTMQSVTEDDCGTSNGLMLSTDHPEDLLGRTLARDTAGEKAGTPIDRDVLNTLRKAKVGEVMARSPMTCQAKHGICSHCLGLLANGHYAPKGYAAGITASQALSEPLTQGSLSAKHTGGGFLGAKKTFAGFPVIEQLMQSPETFPHRASVSEIPGTVQKIEDAPQGGKFIYVNGQQHYALSGYEPIVKVGDQVESGDQLSEGVIDVADILRLRGLGEARNYYVNRLRQAFDESGAGHPHRRNLELLARSALNHVRVDAPDGLNGNLPDDVISYNQLSANYSPPKDMQLVAAETAHGKYLQTPILHYSIGTKLTPRMVKHIQKAGWTKIPVSEQEPEFVPEMVRLRAAAHNMPDWFAKMHTSYLTANIGDDAARSRDTNVQENVHFAPRLAIGEGFGKKIETTGKF